MCILSKVCIFASDGLFHGYAWPVTGVTRLPLCQTPQPPLCMGTWVVIVSRLKYYSDMLGQKGPLGTTQWVVRTVGQASVLNVRENAQECKYATTACMSHFAWVVSQQVRRKSTMGYSSVSYTCMSNTSVCTHVSTDYTGVPLPVCQTWPLRPFVCLFVMQHLFAPRVNPQPCRVYLFAIQP